MRLGKKRNLSAEHAKQATIFARKTADVSRGSGAAPPDSAASGPIAGAGAAQKIVLGSVEKKKLGRRNAGVVTAQAGVHAVSQESWWSRCRRSMKMAVVGALASLAVLAPMQNANADTIFFDHNNAPREIAVARQLAAEINEKFVLVRPDPASVERVFAQAERGEINMRHLILSGHSGGTSFSGQGPDGTSYETSFAQYQRLKERFPRAFAQVKRVTFLACYAGSMSNSALWKTIFENAIMIGFHGIGPSKERPASWQVLANTERYAREHIDGKNLTPQQMQIHARNMTRLQGPNITNFAVRIGDAYASTNETITNVDVARDRANLLRMRAFEPYFNPIGQPARFATPPPSTQQSELQQYYRALQQYRNLLRPDSYEFAQVTRQSEIALRLLHWQQVLRNVQRLHGETFAAAQQEMAAAGFTAVRIPSDLSMLTRLQIVDLATRLDSLGNIALHGLADRHANDIARVNEFLTARGKPTFEMPSPSHPEWQVTFAKAKLKEIVEDAAAPQSVRAAAQAMWTSLERGNFPALIKAREIIVTGLRDLSPTLIPQAWID